MPWWSGSVLASWVVLGAAVATAVPDRPPPAEAVITVSNPGSEPHEGIEIRGCEQAAPPMATDDGTLRFAVVADGCRLQALRWDGGMPAASAPLVVDASTGSATVSLPAWTAGGLGVWFEPVIGGMRVNGVLDGSGAKAAGLQAGDVIVAVDGVPTTPLDARGFQLAVAGPEGTAAAVVVRRRHQQRTFTVERRWLRP